MKHSNSKSWKSINFVKHLLTYSASSLDNPKKSFKVESWTFFIVVPSFFIQNQLEFQTLNSHRSSICFAVDVEGEIMDWLNFKHCMSFITLGTLKLSNLKYCSMQIESYCSWAQSKKRETACSVFTKSRKGFCKLTHRYICGLNIFCILQICEKVFFSLW